MGTRDELRTTLKLVWNDTIRPTVGRILPLSNAQEAREILEKGTQMGKLVLKPRKVSNTRIRITIRHRFIMVFVVSDVGV